jgi:hypothetical protein
MQERDPLEIVLGHMFGESSALVAERVIPLSMCLANDEKIAMIVRRADAPIYKSGVWAPPACILPRRDASRCPG